MRQILLFEINQNETIVNRIQIVLYSFHIHLHVIALLILAAGISSFNIKKEKRKR